MYVCVNEYCCAVWVSRCLFKKYAICLEDHHREKENTLGIECDTYTFCAFFIKKK